MQPAWNTENLDMTWLQPGESIEMPRLDGPGVITHMWFTSHAGWTEAGNANAPQYTGTRKTCVFAAASAGAMALSAALVFTIASNGTIKGCFITYGSGAVNTIDSTAGVLFSAGLFTGGDRAVLTNDIVNVSYSISL